MTDEIHWTCGECGTRNLNSTHVCKKCGYATRTAADVAQMDPVGRLGVAIQRIARLRDAVAKVQEYLRTGDWHEEDGVDNFMTAVLEETSGQ